MTPYQVQLVRDMSFSAPTVKIEDKQRQTSAGDAAAILQVISALTEVDGPVLIHGETGTGKELCARTVHYHSDRKDETVVTIPCGEETLLEDLFQSASEGTVFLDEISDLTLTQQKVLLELLTRETKKPRIVAATTRNLEEMIDNGTFVRDLFTKLNAVSVVLRPLRERREDINELTGHFIAKFSQLHGKKIEGIAPAALETLQRHGWPGNIRELENVVENAVVSENSSQITAASLPGYLQGDEFLGDRLVSPLATLELLEEGEELDFKAQKERFERDFIIRALKTFKGRINQTALNSHIPKKTLLRKLQKYQIRAEDFRL